MIRRRLVYQSSVGVRKFDADCGSAWVTPELVLGSCFHENVMKTRTAKGKVKLSTLYISEKYH